MFIGAMTIKKQEITNVFIKIYKLKNIKEIVDGSILLLMFYPVSNISYFKNWSCHNICCE